VPIADYGQEHQKGRPPGPVIEDRAGNRGRDAAGDGRSRGPDADRTGLLVGGKGLPEHGKAVGQDQGFAQALHEPADDERGETRRETNRGRAQAIDSDPREEDPLLSEPVTQSARDQSQGREREELGVHHPLQVEGRQAHVSANRRECDRDDGAADEHEAAAQARRGEHLDAALRADGFGFGERQAAVRQYQGRAAHDPIPKVGSSDARRASSLASSLKPRRRIRSRTTSRSINLNLKQTFSKPLSLPARAAPPDTRDQG
jgi:hypothetical protein